MSTELDIFSGGLAISDALREELMESTNRAAGSSDRLRISIKGSRFRQMVGSTQTAATADPLNMVLVENAPISRFYFEGAYDPDKTAGPTCWSTDTQVPSPDVPEDQRQASRCVDCPMNAKGSGQNENSRACRFSQRYAVALEGELDKVYQLQIPATSLFGNQEGSKMPMQAYAKFLKANNAPMQAILTQAYFDDESESPKLFFRAVRPLTDDEVKQVLEARASDATKMVMDVSVHVSEEAAPAIEAPKEEPKEEPKKAKKETVSVEDVEEPVKVEKKSKSPEPPTTDGDEDDFSDLLDAWGDD